MESKDSIIKMLHDYEQKFSNEYDRSKAFTEFLYATNEDQLFNRKNFIGHITASAFIINAERNAVLMIQHKALNKWLQPGGHVDENDTSLINAALREAEEETGIAAENLLPAYNSIFDIDSHAIPANPKKMEPAHIHHDVRFLFTCTQTTAFTIDENEVSACQWMPLNELKETVEFVGVVKKIMG